MKIEIYKSAICPRCMFAMHCIKKIKEEYPNLEFKIYNLETDYSDFKEAGILMVPTIKINDNKKYWIIPTTSELKDFILKNLNGQE